MAEWLGQLMSGWPAWVIGVAVVVIFVVGVIGAFYIDAAQWGTAPELWRKRHGKK